MSTIIFVLLLVIPTLLGIDAANCDSKKVETRKCFFEFFALFNITGMPKFEEFGNNMTDIGDKEGWNGEEYICKNGMVLVKCINQNQIDLSAECFSNTFNSSIDDSIGYVTYFYQMQFRCQGKGYQEFKDTYKCAKANIRPCEGKTDSCFAIKKYMECMTQQATDKCGKEYSDFLTTSLQILLKVTYNSCLPPENQYSNSSSNAAIWISITAFAILSAIISAAAIILKCRNTKKKERNKFQNEHHTPTPIQNQFTGFYSNLFIPETKIIVDFEKIYGNGSTATVYSAMIVESKTSSKQIAIKIPLQTHLSHLEEFSHELKIATILKNHSTICAAISWTLYRELPCLIFEKMDIDLLSFVKGFNEAEKAAEFPPTKLFLQFLWQISDALSFIALKKLVHRDVAARNILIAFPNIAKISDFGLCSEFDESSSIYLSSMYKKLPVKWLPPEALTERIFSEKSDVWAFGITMYEMWTKGELPYQNLNYTEQLEFLQSGQRLSIPDEMREDIGEIMLKCWIEDKELRPTFETIKQTFENILEKETINYGYLVYDKE